MPRVSPFRLPITLGRKVSPVISAFVRLTDGCQGALYDPNTTEYRIEKMSCKNVYRTYP